jgi:putative ABC transport system permease protein
MTDDKPWWHPARLGVWSIALARDLRNALRSLGRNPVYATVGLASLALGIGLNTATFSVAHRLLLQPPPGVWEPERLVSVVHRDERGGESTNSFRHYVHYRDHVASFAAVAAEASRPMHVSTSGPPERVSGHLVSGEYFTVLGVTAAAGRMLLPPDDAGAGGPPVVVLSHGFWRRAFGGDPAIVGRQLIIGGHPFTIVGVAGRDFQGTAVGDDPALWVPASFYARAVPEMADFPLLELWGAHTFRIVARLAPGVDLAAARAELKVVGERLAALDEVQSGDAGQWRPAAELLQDARIPAYARAGVHRFLILLGATSVAILLITTLNLANLTAARALRRGRELAVRLSLGASRGRIVRQAVMESLLLSFAGGALGVLAARASTDYLARLPQPLGVPFSPEGMLDVRVLLFAALLCVAVGLLAGLAPARQFLRVDPMHVLKSGEPARSDRNRLRARDVLVVAQVTLSLLLLVPAGLLLRTVQNARAEDVTVAPERLLLARLDLISSGHDPARARQLYLEVVERASLLPGVEGAALVELVPMSGMRMALDILVPAPHEPSGRRTANVEYNVVSADYFRVTGLPLVAGRFFTDRDHGGAAPAAVINERFAAQLWPGQDPLGRTFELARGEAGPITVVGVVRDGRFRSHRAPLAGGFYLSYAQQVSPFLASRDMTLQLRTTGRPLALAGGLRALLADVDAGLPQPRLQTMAHHRDALLSAERLATYLLFAAGLLALGLALLGIYGIVSFLIGQRTREIGIRMALGARPAAVVGLMLRRTLGLTGIGLALGLGAAWLASRMAEGMLYGVDAFDPALYGLVALVVLAVALVTTALPARRAARIEPTAALRWE